MVYISVSQTLHLVIVERRDVHHCEILTIARVDRRIPETRSDRRLTEAHTMRQLTPGGGSESSHHNLLARRFWISRLTGLLSATVIL